MSHISTPPSFSKFPHRSEPNWSRQADLQSLTALQQQLDMRQADRSPRSSGVGRKTKNGGTWIERLGKFLRHAAFSKVPHQWLFDSTFRTRCNSVMFVLKFQAKESSSKQRTSPLLAIFVGLLQPPGPGAAQTEQLEPSSQAFWIPSAQ